MPDFEVTSPQGQKFIVTAPPGATQDQILAYAKQNMPAAGPAPSAPGPSGEQIPEGEAAPAEGAFQRIGREATEPFQGLGTAGDTSTLGGAAKEGFAKYGRTIDFLSRIPASVIGAGHAAIAESLKALGAEPNSAERLARDVASAPEAFAGQLPGAITGPKPSMQGKILPSLPESGATKAVKGLQTEAVERASKTAGTEERAAAAQQPAIAAAERAEKQLQQQP